MKHSAGLKFLALTRIAMGLIFFWAFIDKLFGLGFATSTEKAWINGGSPTLGFLSNSAKGPLADFYHGIAGTFVVDWLFMLGLLFLGIFLIFGIAMRFASYAGALLMMLMWSALLPPSNHPFLDEHVIYALALIAMNMLEAGSVLGFQRWWASLNIVKKMPFLK